MNIHSATGMWWFQVRFSTQVIIYRQARAHTYTRAHTRTHKPHFSLCITVQAAEDEHRIQSQFILLTSFKLQAVRRKFPCTTARFCSIDFIVLSMGLCTVIYNMKN